MVLPYLKPFELNIIFPRPEFNQYRGGCVACFDYYPLANDGTLFGYVNLTTHFDGISKQLLSRLEQFKAQNCDPKDGHAFSMSFGSRLAFDAGIRFGGQLGALDGKTIWNYLQI